MNPFINVLLSFTLLHLIACQIGPPDWSCCDGTRVNGTEQCFFLSKEVNSFIPCENCTRAGCEAWGTSYHEEIDYADTADVFYPSETCFYSPGAQVAVNESDCFSLGDFFWGSARIGSFKYSSRWLSFQQFSDNDCQSADNSWGDYNSATGNHASEAIIFPIEDFIFLYHPPTYSTIEIVGDTPFVKLVDMPDYHPRAPLLPLSLDVGECIHPYSVVECELLGRRNVTSPAVRQSSDGIFIFSDYGTGDLNVFENTGCSFNQTRMKNVTSTLIERMGRQFRIPDSEDSITQEEMCSYGYYYETTDGSGYYLYLPDESYSVTFDVTSQFRLGEWNIGNITGCSDIDDLFMTETIVFQDTTYINQYTSIESQDETKQESTSFTSTNQETTINEDTNFTSINLDEITIGEGININVERDIIVSSTFTIGQGSTLIIGGNLTFSPTTITRINLEGTRIIVTGCVNFAGDLVLDQDPEDRAIISYNCHQGSFSSVRVGDCVVDEKDVSYNNNLVLLFSSECVGTASTSWILTISTFILTSLII